MNDDFTPDVEPEEPVTLPPLGKWSDHAACIGLNPDIFFVERGRNTTEAKRVCATCPVRAECLDYAVENSIMNGVWGGATVRERRAIKRRRAGVADLRTAPRKPRDRKPPACGTYAGAVNHYRKNEKPCDACREARNRYQMAYKEQRARQRQRLTLVREDAIVKEAS